MHANASVTVGRHNPHSPGKAAKIISAESLDLLLEHVSELRRPTRARVMVLLSYKAGLRAKEISGLDYSMITDACGRISDSIDIHNSIAKKGSGRRIPCHPALRRALRKLHAEQGRPSTGPVCLSERGGPLTAKSVVNWFAAQYQELGFEGCSSHSGRRTMITLAARNVSKAGGSLRDVMELAGHRALTTTERYIVGDRDAQRRLIGMI
jgi:integrase/recombinase XerC